MILIIFRCVKVQLKVLGSLWMACHCRSLCFVSAATDKFDKADGQATEERRKENSQRREEKHSEKTIDRR